MITEKIEDMRSLTLRYKLSDHDNNAVTLKVKRLIAQGWTGYSNVVMDGDYFYHRFYKPKTSTPNT
jgi:hypothetical protein